MYAGLYAPYPSVVQSHSSIVATAGCDRWQHYIVKREGPFNIISARGRRENQVTVAYERVIAIRKLFTAPFTHLPHIMYDVHSVIAT